MILFDEDLKKVFINSLKKDINNDNVLKEFFNISKKLLKEDSENFDFNSLRGRCSWFLSKLINNKESILNYQTSDLFKTIFKTVSITSGNNSNILNLAVNGEQITNDNIYILLTFIIYMYILSVSLTSLGDDYDKIGGAVIYKFSSLISSELMKRSDLSTFVLSGSSYKELVSKIPQDYYIGLIVASLVALLLISDDFTEVHKETLLIAINIIKTNIINSIGYLYVFIDKAGQLVKINTSFVAKDIFYQFKSLGINIDQNKITTNTDEVKPLLNVKNNKTEKQPVDKKPLGPKDIKPVDKNLKLNK